MSTRLRQLVERNRQAAVALHELELEAASPLTEEEKANLRALGYGE
jgi:hypothetical protein